MGAKLINDNTIKAMLYSLPSTVDQSVNVLVAKGVLKNSDIGEFKFKTLSDMVRRLAKSIE